MRSSHDHAMASGCRPVELRCVDISLDDAVTDLRRLQARHTLSPLARGLLGAHAMLSIIISCMQADCITCALHMPIIAVIRCLPTCCKALTQIRTWPHCERITALFEASRLDAAFHYVVEQCTPSQLNNRALCHARQCCKAAGMCVIIGLRMPVTLQEVSRDSANNC